jgi:hypothetical protein
VVWHPYTFPRRPVSKTFGNRGKHVIVPGCLIDRQGHVLLALNVLLLRLLKKEFLTQTLIFVTPFFRTVPQTQRGGHHFQ